MIAASLEELQTSASPHLSPSAPEDSWWYIIIFILFFLLVIINIELISKCNAERIFVESLWDQNESLSC